MKIFLLLFPLKVFETEFDLSGSITQRYVFAAKVCKMKPIFSYMFFERLEIVNKIQLKLLLQFPASDQK
jgi:hypothetical protein